MAFNFHSIVGVSSKKHTGVGLDACLRVQERFDNRVRETLPGPRRRVRFRFVAERADIMAWLYEEQAQMDREAKLQLRRARGKRCRLAPHVVLVNLDAIFTAPPGRRGQHCASPRLSALREHAALMRHGTYVVAFASGQGWRSGEAGGGGHLGESRKAIAGLLGPQFELCSEEFKSGTLGTQPVGASTRPGPPGALQFLRHTKGMRYASSPGDGRRGLLPPLTPLGTPHTPTRFGFGGSNTPTGFGKSTPTNLRSDLPGGIPSPAHARAGSSFGATVSNTPDLDRMAALLSSPKRGGRRRSQGDGCGGERRPEDAATNTTLIFRKRPPSGQSVRQLRKRGRDVLRGAHGI